MQMRHHSSALALVLLAAPLLGCSGDDDEGAAASAFSFTADAGGGVFVGIVGNDTAMTGYVCDGDDSAVTVARWFDGPVQGGAFDLGDGDGARLSGQLDGTTSAAITVELPGEDAVELTVGAAAGEATLLRGEVDEFLGGWIFLEDGDARGAVSNRTLGTSQIMVIAVSARSVTFLADGVEVTMPIDQYINAYIVSPR
jgi:hypothetical protein